MATTVDPILSGLDRTEVISDPALRELYFGSTDTPGLINQATRAAQKAYLDQPAILQETAGLTAQEQQARQLAQSGIGSYQPFLDRQRGLIEQGISDLGTQRGLLDESLGGYRAAYGMQQPYFGQAEGQLGAGLGGLFGSLGFGGPSARQLLGQSLQGYDPRMAGQFYNPFEQQVVDQTIQDVLKAGEMQDIQQRASDISRGGESAFGSRARLTAQERQESLGRGLGDVLSKIRSGGFNTAQERALQELQNQRSAAARQLAGDISGVGTGIAGIGANLAGYGSSLGQLGETQQRLRGLDISQLENLGATERGIEEQRLARQYNQQVEQRQSPLLAAQFVQGFAPQYQASKTQVGKTYGMPVDPLSQGLGAALSAYQALKPPMQYQPPQYDRPDSSPSTTGSAYDAYMSRQNTYQPGQINTQAGFNQGAQYNPLNPNPNPYQPGQINTQQAFNSNQYNPLNPNPNPYQPGQINYNPFGPRN